MALWKEPAKSPSSSSPGSTDAATLDSLDLEETSTTDKTPAFTASTPKAEPAAPAAKKSASESQIAPDLVIEGKIEGAGHVRIAGRFKGDINVRGDVTIEKGADVEGSVRAERVTIAGELTGNIDNAAHVDLLESGALTGDVKSGTFCVAKGSRMRGQAEFGWEDSKNGSGSADYYKRNGSSGKGSASE